MARLQLIDALQLYIPYRSIEGTMDDSGGNTPNGSIQPQATSILGWSVSKESGPTVDLCLGSKSTSSVRYGSTAAVIKVIKVIKSLRA